MKKIYTILILLWTNNLFAQQVPTYNQYVLNPFLINPAATGIDKYHKVMLTVRNQWSGIQGSPTTAFLAGSMPIGNTDNRFYAVGASIFHDRIGNFQRTSFNANTAVHLSIKKTIRLSFGAAVGGSSLNFDVQKVIANPNDAALQTVPTNFIWQADVGLWAESNFFFVGASINQLASNSLFPNINEMPKYYTAIAGLKITSKDYENFAFVPSVFFRTGASQQIDITGTFRYADRAWLGGTYRLNGGYGVTIGGEIAENFVISYYFESMTNTLARLGIMGASSHEFSIGYRIKKQQSRRSYNRNFVNIHD